MSSATTRMPLAEAQALAEEVIAYLYSACERIRVAGSIRRGKADIGDLELVCVPMFQESLDLFGDALPERRNMLDERCNDLLAEGVLSHRPDKNGRPAWGSKLKRATYRGVGLDLFAVTEPAQLGVVYLIRTGPADFSHRLVTPKEHGGWMPSGLYCRDGGIWRNGAIVPTPTEHDVFALLGREYIEPEERQ